MTTTNGLTDGRATEGEDAEDERPPYGRLDPDTAAKCGLWI